eukprot:641400-Amphidinium_carterae.1
MMMMMMMMMMWQLMKIVITAAAEYADRPAILVAIAGLIRSLMSQCSRLQFASGAVKHGNSDQRRTPDSMWWHRPKLDGT